MAKANTYAALSLAKTKSNVKGQCHKIFNSIPPDKQAVHAVNDTGDSMSAVSLMQRTFSLYTGFMSHETSYKLNSIEHNACAAAK
jgi:hypothetical protein